MPDRPAAFALQLTLEPVGENLHQLRDWPHARLTPDFIVATSGRVSITLAGWTMAYRRTAFVRLKAGEAPERGLTVGVPDYVGGFALRLAEAVPALVQGESRFVGFVDEPAGLWFERDREGWSRVEYRDRPTGHALLAVKGEWSEVETEIKRSVGKLVRDLLRLNSRLIDHEDVRVLAQFADLNDANGRPE